MFNRLIVLRFCITKMNKVDISLSSNLPLICMFETKLGTEYTFGNILPAVQLPNTDLPIAREVTK